MLKLFNLVFFTPFYFPDGESAKPKYFIPIYIFENEIIFAFLPTRTIRVSTHNIKHGCINENDFHCYMFEKGKVITDQNFAFDFNSFVYDFYLNEFDKSIFEDIYKIENVDYEILGELTKHEKMALIECILKSKNIKLKVKRFLENIKTKL